MRRASAAAHSAMKVVLAASVTVGGRRAGRCCLGWLGPEVVEDFMGWLGWRCPRGARLGLGLAFGSGLGPRCGDGFGWLLGGGPGFLPGCGPNLRWGVTAPAWPVAGREAAAALAVAEAPAVGWGFWGPVGGILLVAWRLMCWTRMWRWQQMRWLWRWTMWSRRRGRRTWGTAGGSQTAGAGAGCLVLRIIRTRVRSRASGVCAPFPWCPTCVPVPVLWVVSCVVLGGIVALARLRG